MSVSSQSAVPGIRYNNTATVVKKVPMQELPKQRPRDDLDDLEDMLDDMEGGDNNELEGGDDDDLDDLLDELDGGMGIKNTRSHTGSNQTKI